jgi:hypothetical protein
MIEHCSNQKMIEHYINQKMTKHCSKIVEFTAAND